MKNKDNFCILPFIHLAIESNGEIKGCCWTPPFKNDDGSSFNINRQSVDSIRSNKDYNEFVESFRKNHRHSYCQKCWRLDDGGTISNRKKSNDMFKQLVREQRKKMVIETQFIELNPGNVCNLKCRICNPVKSSQWAKELYALNGKEEYLSYINEARWVANKEVWSSKILNNSLSFLIKGGEPFFEKNHIQFLKKLIQEGRSSEVSLWYHTNGTVLNRELMELLREFKTVGIAISLDDVGERFHYQRYPGKWDVVLKNLNEISEYNQFGLKIGMDICWSLLNIPYFKEIIQTYENELKCFFVNQPDISVYGIHFYSGLVFCPQLLRKEQKSFLVEGLKQALDEVPSTYSLTVDKLIRHISVDRHHKDIDNLRIRKIREIDASRSQDYRKALPRLHHLLSL